MDLSVFFRPSVIFYFVCSAFVILVEGCCSDIGAGEGMRVLMGGGGCSLFN